MDLPIVIVLQTNNSAGIRVFFIWTFKWFALKPLSSEYNIWVSAADLKLKTAMMIPILKHYKSTKIIFNFQNILSLCD